MRLSRLFTIFKRTNVFYPIIAVAIVVPNVALGAYGYWAIRHAQQQADDQVQEAYLSFVQHVRDDLGALLDELPRKLGIEELESALVDAEASDEPQEGTRKKAAAWAFEHAADLAVLKGFYVVSQRELIVPPQVEQAQQVIANDADDANSAAAAAATLKAWEKFQERVWPRVRAQLHAGGRGMRYVSHRNDETEKRFDVVCLLETITLDETELIGVAWFDEAALERHVVAPRLERVALPAGRLVLIRDTDTRPRGGSLLVSERGAFPHWWIAVKMEDDIGAFRHGGQVGATVNLALLAIFMPFVAVGAVLMIRALVKDIREARQKTDFVSRVTHELKTPLTSIRLFIETLQMGGAQSDEEVKRCLDIIQQESERLSKLIERVLDFSKMEMGNKVYHFREDDIETVVRDTIDFFRKQAVQKGAVIRLYIERNLPRFQFDRDGVREVLLNLLENAIKYSVGEKLAAIRLTRTRWQNQEAVQIQVIDNGVGIRREDMPRIFDQFYRVDDTLTKGIDGSGLGLTLSREIARAHQGDILVESQQGRGSKFTLVLPLRGKA